jgi:hypothetical protein
MNKCPNPGEFRVSANASTALTACARHLADAVTVTGGAVVQPASQPRCQVPAAAPFGFTSARRAA